MVERTPTTEIEISRWGHGLAFVDRSEGGGRLPLRAGKENSDLAVRPLGIKRRRVERKEELGDTPIPGREDPAPLNFMPMGGEGKEGKVSNPRINKGLDALPPLSCECSKSIGSGSHFPEHQL